MNAIISTTIALCASNFKAWEKAFKRKAVKDEVGKRPTSQLTVKFEPAEDNEEGTDVLLRAGDSVSTADVSFV